MGGAKRYKERMRNKKNQRKGRRVNDSASFWCKRKLKPSFHSIREDFDNFKSQLVELPAWYLMLLLR